MQKLRPLNDRVIVERLEAASTSKGGIIIPDAAKERPVEGKVIAAGPGRRDEKGERIPLEFKVGDRILFTKYSGNDIEIDGSKVTIVNGDDIIGVVTE